VTALRLAAPAKLNVSLRVVGRRDDGLHLLDSRLVLLDLADELLLLPGRSGLRVSGEAAANLPLDRTNLAWRGLLAALGGEPPLACLVLEKRIPAAAGLGGGSSDAAAAWRLGRAWRGLPDRATADELAVLASIGADVPFLAAGLPAGRATGIGERVEEAVPLDRHVVLAHPPFGLSTAAVFAELRPDEWGRLENDLLAPALRLAPGLDEVLHIVARAGGQPQLSGSGPTVFSLADDTEHAAAIGAGLERAGVRATITRTRTRPAAIHAIDEEE
jgi:4-diphosphocytidyl-2-C-methyl-D-erythritol kinase